MRIYCKECGKELIEFKAYIGRDPYCYECYWKKQKEKKRNGKEKTKED